jgi:hypothetical protein
MPPTHGGQGDALHMGMLRFGVVLTALLLPALPALADDSFFDEGRAQAAVAKIFDKANHPTKVMSLEIRAESLEVDVQDPAQPRHIDAWTDEIRNSGILRYISPEAMSGPQPVDPTLINSDLEANLFELKPSDLAIVPKLVADAIKQAQLEDPAQQARLTLKRKLFLLPTPSSGPPEWSVEISSGRERATVYADLTGRITHANFDGTRRAQRLNYLAGGHELAAVIESVADALGKAPIIQSILVYDHFLELIAATADHPDQFYRYTAGLNGVYRDVDMDTGTTLLARVKGPPVLFSIGDPDWTLLPQVQKAARERLGIADGHIVYVRLSRPNDTAGDAALEWEMNVDSLADSAIAGSVVFDAKGNVLRTKFPPGRGPKLDMLDAASVAPAFDALRKALGEHAAMTELDFRNERLMVTTKDPRNPDERIVFEYGGESLARSIMPPLQWPTFGPDWYFDLAQAQPVAAHWQEMQQDALTRLGLADGKIERITISKQKLFMPRNDRILVEVRAESGKRDGRVVYDVNGKVVDIVMP